MNPDKKVKAKKTMQDWHEHHKISPYTKYSWPIACSVRLKKKDQNSKT